MFCGKCGEKLVDGAVFCKKCGAKNVNIGNYKKVNIKRSKDKSSNFIAIFLRGGIMIFSLFMVLASIIPFCSIDSKIAKIAKVPKTMSFFKIGDTYADGIILIIFAGIIILSACFNKRIPVLLCSLLSMLVYGYDFRNLYILYQETERELSSGIAGYFADIEDFVTIEAGFYLLPVSIGLLTLTSILYIIKRD